MSTRGLLLSLAFLAAVTTPAAKADIFFEIFDVDNSTNTRTTVIASTRYTGTTSFSDTNFTGGSVQLSSNSGATGNPLGTITMNLLFTTAATGHTLDVIATDTGYVFQSGINYLSTSASDNVLSAGAADGNVGISTFHGYAASGQSSYTTSNPTPTISYTDTTVNGQSTHGTTTTTTAFSPSSATGFYSMTLETLYNEMQVNNQVNTTASSIVRTVPEPGSIGLMAVAAATFAAYRVRKVRDRKSIASA